MSMIARRARVSKQTIYNHYGAKTDLIRALASRRVLMQLIVVFGCTAAALAALGLYGVIAYSVAHRTREIGVRLAMGALPRHVLGLVAEQGARLVGAGIVVGVAGALAASRLLRQFLFGVPPTDPATLAAVTAAVCAVAALACLFPALRAARVHPMAALRHE